ncbi:MAG: YggT family protein [Burkholderiales bacterium]|nr:YggT family protein [Burkholderiales bacterium]
MFSQAGQFLLQTIEFVIVYPALMRFYMQLFRAPIRNPFSNFIIAVTDFAVKPLRRFIPGMHGLDMASLIWAWLAEVLILVLFFALAGANVFLGGPLALPAIVFLAFVKLLRFSIYLLIFAVLVQAILSWVSPYHPLMPVFNSLTRPVLRPLQRFLPTPGGVDFSPLVIFVICQLLLMIPISTLEAVAVRMVPVTG